MKKWIIGIVAVLVIGAGVYFGITAANQSNVTTPTDLTIEGTVDGN